MRLILLQ